MDAEVTFRPFENPGKSGKPGKQVRVPTGTTILEAARRVGLPVASACAAHGLCARCGVTVLAGAANLSAEASGEAEAKRLNRVDASQRLACMTEISGDVEITATYW